MGRGLVAARFSRPPADEQVAVLPLQIAPWPVVEATINGAPVRLMVDTGAATSVLDPDVADSVGLRSSSFVRVGDFEGRSRKLPVKVAGQLDLGGMVFSDVGLVISELSRVTAQSCVSIDGIVGQNVLHHTVTEIDLRGETMLIATSAAQLPERDGGQSITLDPSSTLPQIRLPLEGATPPVMVVDTGAAKGLTVSDKDMRRLFDHGRPTGPSITGRGKVTGGLHGISEEISEVLYFPWPQIDLGGLDLAGVTAVGGVGSTTLGLDVLSHYLVRFDPHAHTLHMWSNGDAPPRGLVDIGMRWRHESGEVTLLVDGSPAQQAGIRLGDRVIEVDGTALEGLPATERCWLALQAPDSDSLWVRVQRGEETFDAELREQAMLPGSAGSAAGSGSGGG